MTTVQATLSTALRSALQRLRSGLALAIAFTAVISLIYTDIVSQNRPFDKFLNKSYNIQQLY